MSLNLEVPKEEKPRQLSDQEISSASITMQMELIERILTRHKIIDQTKRNETADKWINENSDKFRILIDEQPNLLTDYISARKNKQQDKIDNILDNTNSELEKFFKKSA